MLATCNRTGGSMHKFWTTHDPENAFQFADKSTAKAILDLLGYCESESGEFENFIEVEEVEIKSVPTEQSAAGTADQS